MVLGPIGYGSFNVGKLPFGSLDGRSATIIGMQILLLKPQYLGNGAINEISILISPMACSDVPPLDAEKC